MMNLKGKKLLASILITIMAFALVLAQKEAYATATIGSAFWAQRNSAKIDSNTGYSLGDPTSTTATYSNIWELLPYSASTGGQLLSNRELYCVKAGVSATWNDPNTKNNRVNYDKGFDLKAEKSAINSYVSGNSGSDSTKTEYKAIIDDSRYYQILWILDNMYVSSSNNSQDRETLLKAAGIEYESDYPEVWKINDDDIEIVQQLALWHYTNSEEIYTKSAENQAENLYIQNSDTNNIWKKLKGFNKSGTYGEGYGDEKVWQMQTLLQYFLTSAEANKSQYIAKDSSNNDLNELKSPITIDTSSTTLTRTTDSTNNNYIFGTIGITKNYTFPYEVEIEVKNQNNTVITNSCTFLGATVSSGKIDLSNLSNGGNAQLSIRVPKTVATSISVNIKVNYRTSDAIYWIPANLSIKQINGSWQIEQPLVEVRKKDNEETASFTTEEPKQFDLALRKYITKVNNVNVTNTREPNIDKSTINGSSSTTATYKHRKDPVQVKQNDIVTYKITVYNEGEIDGMATEIVDQLPTGLIPNISNGSTVTSSKGNQYTVSYNSTNNKITFTTTNTNKISAYNGTTLDSDTIEFTCKVDATNGSEDKILTNVAWINQDLSDGTADRDSQPSTYPNVNKDNMSDYKGNGNKDDLTDSSYYYKGQQDDDDFEKLIIPKGEFDLALRKYITKINDTNVTTSREPQIPSTNIWGNDSGTTLTKTHTKTPLKVATGDKVTYKIRIYNEGDLAGTATQVTDYLPEGLEFIPTSQSTINSNNGWTNPSGDGKTIVTTKLNGETIQPYDSSRAISTTGTLNPDYRDLEIECKVIATTLSGHNLRNIAAITADNGDDRDSNPDQKPSNNNYNPVAPTNGKGEQDDDDYEDLLIENYFDLALRKYITKVNDVNVTNTRVPNIDESTINGTNSTTATYKHRKDPVQVKHNDIVTYKITVYNEGEIDGMAKEIVDQLPTGLIPNISNGSTVTSSKGNQYTVAYDSTNNKITFTTTGNNKLSAYNGTTLDSDTIEFTCKVEATKGNEDKILTNIAWINEDDAGNGITDRDSQPSTHPDRNKDNIADYKGNNNKDDLTDSDYYYKGQQDDDDFEKLILPSGEFDLALRKFITAIVPQGDMSKMYNVDTRVPELNGEWGTGNDSTTLKKQHRKDALSVTKGDYVLYTIRVYNEGDIDGYASLIEDAFQEGLKFINSTDAEIIKYNGIWSVKTGGNNGGVITTDWLDKGKGAEIGGSNENLIRALKKETNGDVVISETDPLNPDYRDVQVLLEVVKDNDSDAILYNKAQISEDKDKDGNPVDDRDSTPDNGYDNGEDDQDYDPVKLQFFDLALRKFISEVDGVAPQVSRDPNGNIDATELAEGTDTTAKYNHTKTPLKVNKDSKIVYTIRVYNEGNVDGYASKITDHLPEYLEFVPKSESTINTNYGWEVSQNGRTVTTEYLAPTDNDETNQNDKIIKKRNGETLYYREVKIECKIKENAEADKYITNIADISEYRKDDKSIVNPDRDSTSDNVNIPSDNELPDYNGGTDKNPSDNYIPGQEDDDDFEKIYFEAPKYDLALTKFIAAVSEDDNIEDGEYLTPNKNVGSKTNEYTRATVADTTGLKAGTSTNATYTAKKDIEPLAVSKNSYVLYNIRVYNEGQMDVYAGEVTDYLPENLEFVDGEFNRRFGWTADGQKVKTTYLSSSNGTDKILRAFDKENDDGKGSGLDYKDLQILCKVSDKAETGKKLVNTAEITKYEDKDGNNLPQDIDSTPENKEEKNVENRSEDDDDYEVILIPKFDLSLRKFITNISGKDETSRIPQVDTSNLVSGESTTATYTHPKDPIEIVVGDIVTYTIRVYNEGDIDGYAAEIADDIPQYLTYLPENAINKAYGWKMYDKNGKVTDNVSEAEQIKTQFLSKENEKKAGENLIKAFSGKEGAELNYKEVKVAFRVRNDAPAHQVITNKAQISDDTDKDGNPVDDIDSIPGKWNEGEDDQDIENIIPSIFDLSLIKYVSQVQVTEGGKTTVTNTKNTGNKATDIIPKVEIHKKKINSTTVKFIYTIKVTNEGDIPGYAREITDYIPEGLKFVQADNPNWTAKGDGAIATNALAETLLEPGESAPVTVVFTWINGADNLGLKHNTAEISEDYNEKGVPDKDSTPDNKVETEDDFDYADVLLSIRTGKAATYILLTGSVLIVLAGGIILIKKYVLK